MQNYVWVRRKEMKIKKIFVSFAAIIMLLGMLPVNSEKVYGAIDDHVVKSGVSPSGTTINLFDYWLSEERYAHDNVVFTSSQADIGINNGHCLKFGKNIGNLDKKVAGEASQWTGTEEPYTGIVKNTLSGGYPQLNGQNKDNNRFPENYDDKYTESLAYLFNPANTENKKYKSIYTNVGNLLQIGNEGDTEGYYYYNSQKNFAEFDEAVNDIILYDAPGIRASGSSPDGQFFPFNKASDVMKEENNKLTYTDIKSDNKIMNHYFGMTMSTRFIQQYGGHVNENPNSKIVTYEFSGDDDVWIFIDDVLVADLGGIHDAASVKIDFSTGDIVINDKEENKKTLKECFENAAATGKTGWRGQTFADDTVHTLKFFYLERGNIDSNMSLKFNLVSIPESDIIKMSQAGIPVAGAEFQLFEADENYKIIDEKPIAAGETDEEGRLVVKDSEGYIIDFTERYEKEKQEYYVLKETKTPEGYRQTDDINLYYYESNNHGMLLTDENSHWKTGVYGNGKLRATAPDEIEGTKDYTAEDMQTTTLRFGADSDDNENGKGVLFAVVFKKNEETVASPMEFCPISGDPINGYKIHKPKSGTMTIEERKSLAIDAAKEDYDAGIANVFEMDINGQMICDFENLPGDIKTYYRMCEDKTKAEYMIGYYYTEADSLDKAVPDNTYVLINDDYIIKPNGSNVADDLFRGIFSTRLYITNTKNYFAVQKRDQNGNPVNGAEFALYKSEDVTVKENGDAEPKEDAKPVDSVVTKKMNAPLELNGAAMFPSIREGEKFPSPRALPNGEYYLIETAAPDGYIKTKQSTHIIIDNTGIYADAGKENDDVAVSRGVGSLITSMHQFAVNDEMDSSLHDIKAAVQRPDNADHVIYDEAGTFEWNNPADWAAPDADNEAKVKKELHLQYNENDEYLRFEPITINDVRGQEFIRINSGWSRLDIRQCLAHDDETAANKTELYKVLGEENQSIAKLFTGALIVEVTNEAIGSLQISKKITSADGIAAAENTEFTFDAVLKKDGKGVSGAFPYTINNEGEQTATESGTIEFDDNGKIIAVRAQDYEQGDMPTKITLNADQTITIDNLSVGTEYTVEETEKAGWTAKAEVNDPSASGSDNINEVSANKVTGTICRGLDKDNKVNTVSKVVFKNSYNAQGSIGGDTAVSINADKVLKGAELKNGQFDFEIRNKIDDSQETVATGSNNADGSISFSEIMYTVEKMNDDVASHKANRARNEDGKDVYTYRYTVSENTAGLLENGITAEAGSFDIIVNVVDNGDGTLTPTVIYPEDKTGIEFINTYGNGKNVTISINGSKSIRGAKSGLNLPDIAGKYTFTLTGEKDAPLPEKTSVQNDNAGNVSFGNITFDMDDLSGAEENADGARSKTFSYKVSESGSLAGVTNDSSKSFKITVNDDGKGNITAIREPEQGALFEFTNIYDVTVTESSPTGEGNLTVRKVLDGRNMKAGEFKFIMQDKEGNTVSTGTNNDKGEIMMSTVQFEAPGIYEYKIFEEKGSLSGVTYDNNVYTVLAEVTDNAAGSLAVKWSAAEKEKTIEFRNIYKEESSHTDETENTENTDSTDSTHNTDDIDPTDSTNHSSDVDKSEKYVDPSSSDKPITTSGNETDTGDSRSMMILFATLLISGAIIAGTLIYNRKKIQ